MTFPKTYTVQEVADLLRKNRKTIERLVREGHLHGVNSTPWSANATWIITDEAIAAWLRGERPPQAEAS